MSGKRYFLEIRRGLGRHCIACAERFRIHLGASEIRTHVAALLIALALHVASPAPSFAAASEIVSSRADSELEPEVESEGSLRTILARFAAMRGLSVEFREEKRIALLRDPLISKGSIYFDPPDRLARYVREPIPSVVLFLGGRVSYDFEGHRGDLDADRHPMIRGVSSSFRLLLVGDAEGLERLFEVKAEIADSGSWEIVLRPRNAPLRDSIEEMRVRGTGGQLRELEIVERNGDITRTTFSAADPARRFSVGEAEQIFRLPGS